MTIKEVTSTDFFNKILNLIPSDSVTKSLVIDLRKPDDFNASHIESAISVPIVELAQHLPNLFENVDEKAYKIGVVRTLLNRVKMWPSQLLYCYHSDASIIPSLITQLRTLIEVQIPDIDWSNYEFLMIQDYNHFFNKFGTLLCTGPQQIRRFVQNSIETDGNTAYPNEIIEDFLFLGGHAHAVDENALSALNITRILSVQGAQERHLDIPGEYIRHEVTCDQDLQHLFKETIEFLSDAKNKGEKVLVHCAHGNGRSAVAVMAYLIKCEQKPLVEAIGIVKYNRITVQMTAELIEQLRTFENE